MFIKKQTKLPIHIRYMPVSVGFFQSGSIFRREVPSLGWPDLSDDVALVTQVALASPRSQLTGI